VAVFHVKPLESLAARPFCEMRMFLYLTPDDGAALGGFLFSGAEFLGLPFASRSSPGRVPRGTVVIPNALNDSRWSRFTWNDGVL
jgi:hypothetical protein